MMIKDTREEYGAVSRVLHWSMALAFFLLIALGWWMVGLDYYSPYYKSAPDLHRSVGLLVLVALGVRIAWRLINVKPVGDDLSPVERTASRVVHLGFYPLLIVLLVSGYLISTADGRAIDVYGWFSVPAVVAAPGLEDAAGLVHQWSAYAVMALAVVHSAAALKHRYWDVTHGRHRMW
jgi:cytochrome b561